MKKRLIALLLVAVFVLVFAGCGKNAAETTSSEVIEDGQNPVMNFIGTYDCERAHMTVECEGTDSAKVTVLWGGGAWDDSVWTMSGKLDTQTLTVDYNNGKRSNRHFNDDGTLAEETVIYENGTGKIVFHPDDNSVTWQDDTEHVADDMVFQWSYDADQAEQEQTEQTETAESAEQTAQQSSETAQTGSGDEDHYSFVTAMNATTVEDVCTYVKQVYLDEDWKSIAGMIKYPITINNKTLNNADEFRTYMDGKKIHDSDRKAMEEENVKDMFVNGQGICMGSGQIWLNDPNYMTDEEPTLQIIAINGIEE